MKNIRNKLTFKLMAGLVALFNEVIMPRVNTEVTELFDAAG